MGSYVYAREGCHLESGSHGLGRAMGYSGRADRTASERDDPNNTAGALERQNKGRDWPRCHPLDRFPPPPRLARSTGSGYTGRVPRFDDNTPKQATPHFVLSLIDAALDSRYRGAPRKTIGKTQQWRKVHVDDDDDDVSRFPLFRSDLRRNDDVASGLCTQY